MHGKPRIVVDSNVFVAAVISPAGPAGTLLAAWRLDQVVLLVAPMLLAEYSEVLRRPALRARHYKTDAELSDFFMEVLTSVEMVTPLSSLPIRSRDPDDDMFLAVALGGRADYLVTGDDDLLVLNGDPAIENTRIVTVRDFLALLAQEPA